MDLVPVRKIIALGIIKKEGQPIKNHNIIKKILEIKGVKPIRWGKRDYYDLAEVYEKCGVKGNRIEE